MNSASKSTADPAKKVVHGCLFCGQRILVLKDRQGNAIALNEKTLQLHGCLSLPHERSQLKMPAYTRDSNDNNNSKDERRLRQSSLLEFIPGDDARNESNHDNDSNAIRPATLIELAGDGGPS
jgi:hypothetical protein